jgi:uncharacterized protein YgbK (DUF1537 family)
MPAKENAVWSREGTGVACVVESIEHNVAIATTFDVEDQVSRVVVAGGDTSSHAVAALDIWGLSYRAAMVQGAPLCRVHSDDPRLDGLDIILKGGQMGPPSFFADATRR